MPEQQDAILLLLIDFIGPDNAKKSKPFFSCGAKPLAHTRTMRVVVVVVVVVGMMTILIFVK